MVRAVLFDLFETLVTEVSVQPTRASRLGAALGLPPEPFRSEWKARRPRVMLGAIGFGEALAEIFQTLSGTVDPVAIERVCQQRMREKAAAFARIDADVAALVSDLRRRGLALAVVSNCCAEDVHGWAAWPLAREFEVSIFSCSAGIAKPHPGIYLKAAERLRVEPGEAVFIGDGGDDELAGAERAGLRAFRATWFSRRWAHAPQPESTHVSLAAPQDVLRVLEAG